MCCGQSIVLDSNDDTQATPDSFVDTSYQSQPIICVKCFTFWLIVATLFFVLIFHKHKEGKVSL